METEEELVLPSREAIPYSWRSTRAKQLLRIMLHSLPSSSSASSSKEVDVDQDGIFSTTLTTSSGQEATLIIKVLKLSGTVKQVN